MASDTTLDDPPEPIRGDLPPSCSAVWLYLSVCGISTQTEIAADTGISQRTVRYALQRLQEADVVREQRSIAGDARCTLYHLVTSGED